MGAWEMGGLYPMLPSPISHPDERLNLEESENLILDSGGQQGQAPVLEREILDRLRRGREEMLTQIHRVIIGQEEVIEALQKQASDLRAELGQFRT